MRRRHRAGPGGRLPVTCPREQIAEEREARRRADMIIAQLTQTNTQISARVLELDAPDRGPGEDESVGRGPARDGAPEQRQETTERPWWRRMFGGYQEGSAGLAVREQLETVLGGRRTVELTIRLRPDEVLRELREGFMSRGSYSATVETGSALEVEDRTRLPGCFAQFFIAVLALATFGLALLLFVLWVFTSIRRLRFEVESLGPESTRLAISGYPQQAVSEAEQWIRANLPVEAVVG